MARLTREKKRGLTYQAARRKTEKLAPQLLITVTARDANGDQHTFGPAPTFPKKIMQERNLQLVLERTEVSFKSLQELHTQIHAHAACACPEGTICQTIDVRVSFDGVPEANAGQTVDIVSIQFRGCRTVYHGTIYRPQKGHKLQIDDVMVKLKKDLEDAGMRMYLLVADNPMRCSIRHMKGSGSYYACDYCIQRASMWTERTQESSESDPDLPDPPAKTKKVKRKKRGAGKATDPLPVRKKRGKIFWPAERGAIKSDLRTHAGVEKILDDFDHLDKDAPERKGIMARSVLLDLEGFDIIKDIPCDPMHTVFKGLVDMMLRLAFQMGTTHVRPRPSTCFPRLPMQPLNVLIATTKVPKEFSRRTRDLDVRTLKAEELRNVTCFLFPAVTAQFPLPSHKAEHELWILLAYLVRACIFPDEVPVPRQELEEAHGRFYRLFEDHYGPHNLIYCVHLFSHLPIMRDRGAFPEISCFDAESSYAPYRDHIRAGTMSTAKQGPY